jgi:hypothetical protein
VWCVYVCVLIFWGGYVVSKRKCKSSSHVLANCVCFFSTHDTSCISYQVIFCLNIYIHHLLSTPKKLLNGRLRMHAQITIHHRSEKTLNSISMHQLFFAFGGVVGLQLVEATHTPAFSPPYSGKTHTAPPPPTHTHRSLCVCNNEGTRTCVLTQPYMCVCMCARAHASTYLLFSSSRRVHQAVSPLCGYVRALWALCRYMEPNFDFITVTVINT